MFTFHCRCKEYDETTTAADATTTVNQQTSTGDSDTTTVETTTVTDTQTTQTGTLTLIAEKNMTETTLAYDMIRTAILVANGIQK